MGFVSGIRRLFGSTNGRTPQQDNGRILAVPTGYNIRELGGYATPAGITLTHRYLRSGGTDTLSKGDLAYLRDYGVTHVLDLRGDFERPARTCRFARQEGIAWLNVPLFDYDISDPRLTAVTTAESRENYLVESYLTMLANRRAIHRIFRFFARAQEDGPTTVLFHCAAGMDRTGMTAMLLLGLVDASRSTIIADYTYSFGSVAEVDAAVDTYLAQSGDAANDSDVINTKAASTSGVYGYAYNEQLVRMQTIDSVYTALLKAYGSVRDYLLACDLTSDELALVRASLVDA